MGNDKQGRPAKPKKYRPGDEPSTDDFRKAAALEESLFGGADAAVAALDDALAQPRAELSVAQLVRKAAAETRKRPAADDTGKAAKPKPQKQRRAEPEELKPAWTDEADAELVVPVASVNRLRKLRQAEEEEELPGDVYVERLREHHRTLNPRTGWAKLKPDKRAAAADGDGDEEGEGDEGDDGEGDERDAAGGYERVLQQAGPLVRQGAGAAALGIALPAGELTATRVPDANVAERSSAVVRSVAFHPTAPLLLTAGMDKSLRLFQVDGSRNPKVQGVYLEDMPIYRAAFTGAGEHVVATGRRRHFYVYHLAAGRVERVAGIIGCPDKSLESFVESPAGASQPLLAFLGNEGTVPIVSLGSRACVAQLKMNGTARAGAFADGGRTLLTAGGDGQVYTWDLRMNRCLERMVDDGALNISTLAVSPRGDFLATGGDAGVVNLYDRSAPAGLSGGVAAGMVRGLAAGGAVGAAPVGARRPVPRKALMNLTTEVDTMSFSPDGQMLAFASRMKKDSLRITHLPSCTVFANWPSGKTPLHYVHSLAFSPNCGYFAVGNARGRVLLYRLHHYDKM